MKQRILTGARKQKVVVEYRDETGPEWWVMFDDGQVESFDTASAALRAIRKAASRRNTTVTVTTVEWRNVPNGWKPPE